MRDMKADMRKIIFFHDSRSRLVRPAIYVFIRGSRLGCSSGKKFNDAQILCWKLRVTINNICLLSCTFLHLVLGSGSVLHLDYSLGPRNSFGGVVVQTLIDCFAQDWIDIVVNIPPSQGIFQRKETRPNWFEPLIILNVLGRTVKPTGNPSLLNDCGRRILFLAVITSQTVDVSRKGRIKGPHKILALGTDQLIDHSIMPDGNLRNQIDKVVQKIHGLVLF
mmetsp:Transcript_17963/g.44734  ORF Transcript_17963/g.44734 Transcript_17963/m.44734 type:complete len:221 (-) Transcript_17963:1019-1681(-)